MCQHWLITRSDVKKTLMTEKMQKGRFSMIAVPAYYDGENIKPLEEISIKQNQKVILTIMDEFVGDSKKENFLVGTSEGKKKHRLIEWAKYEVSGKDMRDGLSPEEYVRKLREQDRDEILF